MDTIGQTGTRARRATLAGVVALLGTSLGAWSPPASHITIPDYSTGSNPTGIVRLPVDTDLRILQVFQNGTIVRTPAGRPMHMLIQRGVGPLEVMQARNAIEEVLAPVPGSRYGEDKTKIAEAIADAGAVFMLFRDERSIPNWRPGSLAGTKLGGMALLADQIEFAGDPPGKTPDTSLSAAVRYVYEFGIVEAMPDYADRVEAALDAALARGVVAKSLVEQFERTQAASIYLATAVEVYYDMWAEEPTGIARKFYGCATREQLSLRDPEVMALIEGFFAPDRPGMTLISPALDGSFSMAPEPGHRGWLADSHLTNATMTGSRDGSIVGNARDNRLIGNDGDNTFTGAGGDDTIEGGLGSDLAVYRGPIGQYHVERDSDTIYVIDLVDDRDGSDVLTGVERLRFKDVEITTRPE